MIDASFAIAGEYLSLHRPLNLAQHLGVFIHDDPINLSAALFMICQFAIALCQSLGVSPSIRFRLRGFGASTARVEWSSLKTRKNAATALRGAFAWALDEEYLADNPAARFKVKRRKGDKSIEDQRPEADPYSAQERDALPDRGIT